MSKNRNRRTTAAVIAVASMSLLAASACTGSSGSAADDDPDAKTTINFWHGWSADSEVKAIEENIARFEKAHPNITVKMTSNVTDDKINQALRAGGDNAPDAVSSFTTDSVGSFCTTGAFVDLNPFLEKSGVDKEKVFPSALREYTQFEGNQCTLPLLTDAYGLYYNKDAFEEAGIKEPPKTWSEFTEVAKKLTKSKGDSYEQLGMMPTYHGYAMPPQRYIAQWGPAYFDSEGKSNIAKDPAFAEAFTYQKGLIGALGGFTKLEKYRNTFGDQYGPEHPFHTGQVAMQLDGEWRLAMAKDAGVDFEIGTAPLPVPDDQVAEYGKGYLAGTIVGVASTSKKQNAAWELVKYLTTDTEAVVSFANGIHNIPSTIEALESPDLEVDPEYQTFIEIAQNPHSNTTPAQVDGGEYQVTIQDFGYAYESGKTKDLQAGLEKTAAQIDTDIAKAQ
jgi:multiple sugar transport system substrate-binding protein